MQETQKSKVVDMAELTHVKDEQNKSKQFELKMKGRLEKNIELH